MYGMFPEKTEIEMSGRKEKEKGGALKKAAALDTIPALSVRGGEPVKPLADGFEEFDISFEDAIVAVLKKYPKLLLVDYDGLLKNRPQFDVIQDIQDIAKDSDGDIELWVEGGVRYADSAIDLFVAGADAVVICTSLIADMGELRKASELSDQLVLSIDFDGKGIVAQQGAMRERTPGQLATECREMEITRVILDNVVTEDSPSGAGDLGGVAKELLRLTPAPSIYVHRDSSELRKDLGVLEGSGIAGVILDLSESDLGFSGGGKDG